MAVVPDFSIALKNLLSRTSIYASAGNGVCCSFIMCNEKHTISATGKNDAGTLDLWGQAMLLCYRLLGYAII
jgi:hypothetical protein